MRVDNMKLWYLNKLRSSHASGSPPLTFESNGQPVTRWSITGAEGGVGDRTENLFCKKTEMEDRSKWIGGRYHPEDPQSICYFIFFRLPPQMAADIKENGVISAKVFKKDQGVYLNGMVISITPQIVGSVDTEYRILQNNGTILNFVQDVSEWENIYLSIGYGPGIIIPPSGVDRSAQMLSAFFDNYDLSIAAGSLPPNHYEPYGFKIPIVCGGQTTNVYLDEPLGDGDSITGAETGVAIPTASDTNTLSVGTIVQPSGVSVSAEPDMPTPLERYLYSKFIINND